MKRGQEFFLPAFFYSHRRPRNGLAVDFIAGTGWPPHPSASPPLFRACLKSGGVPDWGRFFCRARRFDAGILADFKSNQRSIGGKRCPETAFRWILNRLLGGTVRECIPVAGYDRQITPPYPERPDRRPTFDGRAGSAPAGYPGNRDPRCGPFPSQRSDPHRQWCPDDAQ